MNYIYCIVDENGIIRKGPGSSSKTEFFKTPVQVNKWVEFHNRNKEDKWRMAKFALVENEIDSESLGTLCICALRYSMGRQTYMPDLVRGIVRNNIQKLSDKDIHVMLNDCDFQERCCLYGDERIDKPGWVTWKEELQMEIERRNHEAIRKDEQRRNS